jgi:predicted transcriptional regulator
MTLRLSDDESSALREQAAREQRSMQEVARQAIRDYLDTHGKRAVLDAVLDTELTRYADALERLGR